MTRHLHRFLFIALIGCWMLYPNSLAAKNLPDCCSKNKQAVSSKKNVTQGLTVELLSEVQSIAPGKPFRVGLLLKPNPGFHTYWKNPGIVGIPTSMCWDTPKNFTVSPIQWPYPELGNMAKHPCYTYQRDVLLSVTITPPNHINQKHITLTARTQWMCCKDLCYPGFFTYSMTLPINNGKIDPKTAKWFQQADQETPKNHPQAKAALLQSKKESEIKVTLTLPAPEKPLATFNSDGQHTPDEPSTIQAINKTEYLLTFKKSHTGPQNKNTFPFVLKTNKGYYNMLAK